MALRLGDHSGLQRGEQLLLSVILVLVAAVKPPEVLSQRYEPVRSPHLGAQGAERWCEIRGGMLATALDAESQAQLEAVIGGTGDSDWWFGLVIIKAEDDTSNGVAVWLDGTNASYANWAPGEPAAHAEACAQISAQDGAFLWVSTDCSRELPFICQFDDQNTLACQGTNATLTCLQGHVLRIESGKFGRSSPYLCLSEEVSTWHSTAFPSEDVCSFVNVTDLVNGLCQGVQTCQAASDSTLFGEPCPTIGSYLQIDYSCLEALHLSFADVVVRGENISVYIEWLLSNADSNVSCSVSMGDGHLVSPYLLSQTGVLSHSYTRPGVYTVHIECAAGEWHSMLDRDIAVQQPVSGFTSVKCFLPSNPEPEPDCVLPYGQNVTLEVHLLGGTNVTLEVTLGNVTLALSHFSDDALSHTINIAAEAQLQVGPGHHIFTVHASNNVSDDAETFSLDVTLLEAPTGLVATVTSPFVEVDHGLAVEAEMSRGAPSSLALELVGLDGALVSREEVVQWNGSKNGFNLSASKQGIFQVRVTAYNRLGNITVMAGNITALYSVSILELKVTEHVSCPPGRATFWLKPREPAQVPSIIHYSAHFGDGETDSGEVFDLEISHDYRKIGRFTATIKLSNPVSTFVLSASLMILWHGEARGEHCQSPSVTVSGGGSSAEVATTYLSSESFVLSAAVSPDAVNASTLPFLHFEWQVAVASGDNLTDMELSSQTITNRSELLIPSSAFSPDVYRARFFAWAAEETEPVTLVAPQRIEIGQAEVFFKVVAAPLQATIEGGSVRRIGAGYVIIMDGSSSRDPDAGAVPSQLNYTWSCDKCPESCLDNRHQARLTLKDGCLTAGSEVIFRLTVSSTDKPSAQAEQRLVVLSGQVPDVSIQCIENCVSWVVPAKRLVLMAKCNNCTTQIYYYWSLRQDVGDQNDSLPTAVTMQEQEFEWGAASTTGREQVFLAIRPNGLATLTGHLVFRVTVTTSQGELTFSEWSAQLPSRPTKGHCSVLPSRGRSLSTLFTVACNGFSTVMPPLTYCITAGQGDDAVLLNCGREAVVTSITLPPGDAVVNNNLDLTVKATDSLGGSISHKLSVIVEKQTIDTMLEDGSSSLDDLEVLARTENLPALTRLVQAIVPALTDTPPSPAEPPSSEGKIKDMKRKKHIEVRKRMISALASVPVQTVEAVQQVSQAMSTVTAVPEEVTVSMQLSTTQALLGLSDSLLKLSANASGRAGPGKEDVARFLVMATGHVLEALRASTLMGEEEEENDRETKSGIEERQKVTAGVLGTVDRLQNVLLSDRVPGEEVISVSTPALALALDRCKPGTLANYQIQGTEETSGSFSLPKSLPIPDGDDNAIDVEMVSFANNPYSWSENGSEVTGMVSSLTLKSSKDRGVLPVHNLSESIEIMLPRSGKSASAITWTEISADGNLTVIAVNITRDDTALVVVVEARSRAVLPAMFLFLRVDEWPTETEYNLTASLGHYTGHTWVINAEELPGLGTYYLAIKVAAEEAEGPEIWTTPGTLQERNGSLFLATFSARCLFWMDEEQTWSGSGCKVGPRTTPLVTQCLCYHLTSFGAGFLVLPNTVDVSRTVELFATVHQNPVVVSAVGTVLLLYLFVLIWASRADRQDMAKAKVTILADNDPAWNYRYLVTLYTGHRRGAHTTAKVTITLYGSDGQSEPHHLADRKKPLFERGGSDTFLLTTSASLGEMLSVRLWHDNSGQDPSWYISRVTVHDLDMEHRSQVLCDSWLAVDVGEGLLDRNFPVSSPAELTQFRNLFYQKTTRDLRDGHLWFSVLSRPPRSNFTRVQRVSCCLSLLLCTMLTSIMFWGVPKDAAEQHLDLGEFEFTWTEIMIGIESSIIMFPINLLIVQIFRLARPKPNRLVPGHRPATASSRQGSNRGWRLRRLPWRGAPTPQSTLQAVRNLVSTVSEAFPSLPRVRAPNAYRSVPHLQPQTRRGSKEMMELHPYNLGTTGPTETEEAKAGDISRLLELVSETIRMQNAPPTEFYCDGRKQTNNSLCLLLDPIPISTYTGREDKAADICLQLQQIREELWELSEIGGPDARKYREALREVDRMLELLDASDSSRICKSAAANSEGSKRGGLPWWMVYLGWILVALTSAVSAFFTMLYGLTYGRKRSLEWLLSIGVSIFQSIFITQPLKVLGFAAFFALVLKRVDDEPEMTEPVEDALSGQLHLPGGGCQVARESLVYQPPSVQHVKDLKKKRQLEQRMYSLFREILAYVCFLWILLLVVYGQRDPNAFHLNRAISRSLGSPGEEVLSHRAMYHWANSSLLSGLFGQNPGFLADGASFLVGGVRLRQVRISNHSCKPPSSLVSEVPNCRAPYSWEKEDRRDYVGDGWLLPVSDNDTAALHDHSTEALTVDGESKLVGITTDGSWKNTAWQYRGSSKLRSYPVWGRFALYRGGGYALDLGTDKATAQRTLNYLQRTNWLDTQTRALFVEFTIYNANVNLFCVATLILENSGLGGFLSWMDLHSLRLYQNTAGLHIFVVTAEIIYFLFIIYYMVMQVKAIRAQGWCFLRGHWNLVDTALIVLSWTALAFFVQRTLYAQRDIALFRAQPDRFVSFYQAALSDAALGYLLSLIVLLATTKMWQLLRLNPKLSLLTGALRRAGQDMRSFLTLLSITLGAYAVSCHLMLGATLERYKTIWDSLQTMFSLQLGIFNYEEVFNTSPVLGPLMIGSCIIFMTFTILNLFISVILVAFAEEQENHKPSDDEEIVDMLVWKICSFFGIKRPTGVTN